MGPSFTCRTIQGRFLLRPSQQLNDILLGVLGRAQDRYPLEIVAFTFLSSHMHLLLRVPDAQRLAEFMGYFNGNLAREVGRLTGWFAAVWARRYDAILVSDEETAQVGRLRYCLAQGVKEHLVAQAEDWPGVHSARALITGEPVEEPGTTGPWRAAYASAARLPSLEKSTFARRSSSALFPAGGIWLPPRTAPGSPISCAALRRPPRPNGRRRASSRSASRPSWSRTRRRDPCTSTARRPPSSTRQRRESGRSCEKLTAGFWPPFGKPRTSSRKVIETRRFPQEAFRRTCRSCRPEALLGFPGAVGNKTSPTGRPSRAGSRPRCAR